jgi:hypothetical protein
MLELIFCVLPLSYFSILSLIIYLNYKKGEQLITQPQLDSQISSTSTINEKTERRNESTNLDISMTQQKPSYKRPNLTIEIPDTPSVRKIRIQEIDHDSIFIREYILSNCFPVLLFNERGSGLSRIAKMTIWYTVFSAECYLVIAFYNYEVYQSSMKLKPIVVSLITILCCCPLSSILTLMMVRYGEYAIFKIFNWITMGICMGFIFALPIFAVVFIEEELEIQVIMCCSLVFAWEIIVLEVIKTSIKTTWYMHARDFNCCFSLAQKV